MFKIIGKNSYKRCILLMIFLFAFSVVADTTSPTRRFLSISSENPYLPILLGLGILLAIATFFAPRFGLVVMLLSVMVASDMPIGVDTATERAITIRMEDIILILVSLGWLFNRAKTRTLTQIKHVPVYTAIMAMSGVIIISTIFGYLQNTVSIQRGFFFAMKRLEYFWIFFMTFNLMESDKEAKRALYILLFVSLIVACIGIIQFFFFPLSELTTGGATGTAGFGRANTMGDFLLIVIGLSMGLIIYAKNPKTISLSILLFLIFATSLILTKSRGAYVSFPPLLFMIFLVSKSKKGILILLACTIFVGLYFLILNMGTGEISFLFKKHHEEITEQFTQIANVASEGVDVDPSLHSRVVAWRLSIDQVISYPFLGQGCGAKKLGYTDNQYVQEALETGIIGLTIFLYMNLMIFFFLYRYFKYTNNLLAKSLTLGFMGGHTGMMVHGITMVNFYTIFNMEVFWLVLAFIMIFYYNERKERNNLTATENAFNAQRVKTESNL